MHHSACESSMGFSIRMGIGDSHPQAWWIETFNRGQKVDERKPLTFDECLDPDCDVGERVGS